MSRFTAGLDALRYKAAGPVEPYLGDARPHWQQP